jgi:hypothetical protein
MDIPDCIPGNGGGVYRIKQEIDISTTVISIFPNPEVY